MLIIKSSIILIICFLLTACINFDNVAHKHCERSKILMNTVVTLKANGADSEVAVNESFEKILKLENIIKEDIKNIEMAAESGEFIKISPEVYEILKTAYEFSILTNGAFDVTTGAAIELWNIESDNPRVPSDEEIENIKRFVNFKHLELNDSDCSARLNLKGVKINLGGIAKGYGVDLVRQIFIEHQINDGLIDFGTSTIYAFGKKRIGLRNPRQINEISDIIELEDSAISTSGDYIKFFIIEGKRYHHIIDPRTCKPSDNGISAVTVTVDGKVDNCAMVADILSTTIFILGPEQAEEIFSRDDFLLKDVKIYYR